MNRRSTRIGRAVPLAVALMALAGGIGFPTPAVHARQAVFVAGAPGGPGIGGRSGPPVTQKQLEGYAEALNLTEDQRIAANELLDAMQAEYAKAAAEHREAMQEVQAEFQETRDTQIIMKSMPELMGKFQARRTELESGFLEDLKLTLSDEQAAMWPGIERMRRRDLAGNGTMLSGESIDLVKLVKELEPSDAVKSEIAPVMERYEVDYDRALVERQKKVAENQSMFAGGPPPDPQTMMARMAEVREQSVKVRDVNRSYARQIQNLLPPELAERFDTALKKASFPQVYGPGHTLRSIDTALAFEDLTAEQKAALNDIKESYLRDVDQLNDKWAEAIEAEENDPNAANISMMGGQTMRIVTRESTNGEEPEDPVAKATAARRDLDSRALDRARGLLNPDQQGRLPKRSAQPGGVWAGSADEMPPDAMIVEVSESHDGVNEPQRSVRVSRPSTGESTEVNNGGGAGGTPPEPPSPPPAPQ